MKNLFFIFFVSTTLFALDPADEASIRGIVDEYVDAWNHHAGRGFADNFSEDADFINILGMTFHGKEAIQDRHIEIHQTFLKDSTFEVTNFKLREVNPETTIVLVYWKVDGFQKPGTNLPKEMIEGVFSHTFIKNDGQWEIVSCHNTLTQ